MTTVNGSLVTLDINKPLYAVSATYISANYYEATVAAITAYTTNKIIGLILPNCLLMTTGCEVIDDSGVRIHLSGSKIDGNFVAQVWDNITTSSGCLTLAITGVSSGSYNKVQVDAEAD